MTLSQAPLHSMFLLKTVTKAGMVVCMGTKAKVAVLSQFNLMEAERACMQVVSALLQELVRAPAHYI